MLRNRASRQLFNRPSLTSDTSRLYFLSQFLRFKDISAHHCSFPSLLTQCVCGSVSDLDPRVFWIRIQNLYPDSGSGSRVLKKILNVRQNNVIPIPGSVRKQLGSGFRFLVGSETLVCGMSFFPSAQSSDQNRIV